MTTFEAWASQVGQIGNGVRHPAPTPTGLVEPRSIMGHGTALLLMEANGGFGSTAVYPVCDRSSKPAPRREIR
jgi:hypothetical protein